VDEYSCFHSALPNTIRFRYTGLARRVLGISGLHILGVKITFGWGNPRSCLSYNAAAMIAKDLLEILVCPACKKELEHRENPESLKCVHCHRVYPVRDDIPIMLVDEATIEAP
jgi:uncharacterized protein